MPRPPEQKIDLAKFLESLGGINKIKNKSAIFKLLCRLLSFDPPENAIFIKYEVFRGRFFLCLGIATAAGSVPLLFPIIEVLINFASEAFAWATSVCCILASISLSILLFHEASDGLMRIINRYFGACALFSIFALWVIGGFYLRSSVAEIARLMESGITDNMERYRELLRYIALANPALHVFLGIFLESNSMLSIGAWYKSVYSQQYTKHMEARLQMLEQLVDHLAEEDKLPDTPKFTFTTDGKTGHSKNGSININLLIPSYRNSHHSPNQREDI